MVPKLKKEARESRVETACHLVRLSITCVVELFIFRVGRVRPAALSTASPKDVIVSLLLQVFSFERYESRI